MFTLPHIYVATKLAKNHHPLLVLGSFLPDVGLVAVTQVEKNFAWGQLHEGGDQLWQCAQRDNQKFLPLAVGVMSHGTTYGLDKYSDRVYHGGQGYAHAKAKPLHGPVTRCCRVKPKIGKVWAHNFIEMAVNLWVAKKYPETLKDLKKVSWEVDPKTVVDFVTSCFKVEKGLVSGLFVRLLTSFNVQNLTSVSGLAKIWAQLAWALEGVKVNQQEVKKNIREGVALVKDDWQEFLDEAIKKMRKEKRWVISKTK